MISLLEKLVHLKTSFLIQLICFEQQLGTLLYLSFTIKVVAVQREVQHLQPQQKFICRLIIVLAYLRNYTLQKFANNFLIKFILFLNVRTWKNFSITSKIFTKILSLLWRRKVMEKQLQNSFHYCNSTKCQPLC